MSGPRGPRRLPLVSFYPPFTDAPARDARLTPNQALVLESLVEGKANKAIAADWGISEDTVKSHMKDVLRALGARDRTHAVALVYSGAVRVLVPDRYSAGE